MADKDICDMIHGLPAKERGLVGELVRHLATRGQDTSDEQAPGEHAGELEESKGAMQPDGGQHATDR